MHDERIGDGGFDARARDAHRAAADSLSPRVRAQLRQRTRLALGGIGSAVAASRPAAPRWGWVAAPALALALAFALPRPAGDSPGNQPAETMAEAPAQPTELAAPLEQDPDFYLWLASADAVALAADRP